MKFSDLEDATAIVERLDRIEKAIEALNDRFEKLLDRFDNWLRWIIGLQLGLYMIVIGAYFLRK